MSPTPLGPGLALFNAYSLEHVGGVYEGNLAARPNTRPFILSRSGFAGLQRYGATVWSGDIAPRWSDLKNQIAAGVGFSLSGLPNWTMDIGGYQPEARYLASRRQGPGGVARAQYALVRVRRLLPGVPLARADAVPGDLQPGAGGLGRSPTRWSTTTSCATG